MAANPGVPGVNLAHEVLDSVQAHIRYTETGCRRYYALGQAATWSIPIVSAIVTAFAARGGELFGALTFWISLILTILTGLSAAVNPWNRFSAAARWNNRFHQFRGDFLSRLEAAAPADRRAVIDDARAKLAEMIDQYNSNIIPKPPEQGGGGQTLAVEKPLDQAPRKPA